MADKGGEIYCKACYAKAFGPKGYGYGGGLKDTGPVKSVDAKNLDGKQHTLGSVGTGNFCGDCGAALGASLKFCPECGKPAPASAEPAAPSSTPTSPSSSDHADVSSSVSVSVSVSASTSSSTTEDHSPTSASSSLNDSTHSPSYSSSSSAAPSSSSSSSSSHTVRPSSVGKVSPSLERPSSLERPLSPKQDTKKVVIGGDNPKCPSCGKSVYHAEKVIGAGQTWHQDCFKCSVCRNRFVNAGEANDKDGKIFCRACYAKNFGPKGYGFGGGSASTFAHTQ